MFEEFMLIPDMYAFSASASTTVIGVDLSAVDLLQERQRDARPLRVDEDEGVALRARDPLRTEHVLRDDGLVVVDLRVDRQTLARPDDLALRQALGPLCGVVGGGAVLGHPLLLCARPG